MAIIGILGGTGPLGRGLGLRLARAGHEIILGSRDAARANAAVDELVETAGAIDGMRGAANQEAVDAADIVLVSVPFEGVADTIAELDGLGERLVVSCVNPLGFDERGPHAEAVDEGSAAELIAAVLARGGGQARVTAAFHHLSAPLLLSGDDLHESVLVVGDDRDDVDLVCDLANDIVGRPGVDAGALRNSQQIEAMTAVLIAINKRYRTRAGFAVTGVAGQLDSH